MSHWLGQVLGVSANIGGEQCGAGRGPDPALPRRPAIVQENNPGSRGAEHGLRGSLPGLPVSLAEQSRRVGGGFIPLFVNRLLKKPLEGKKNIYT